MLCGFTALLLVACFVATEVQSQVLDVPEVPFMDWGWREWPEDILDEAAWDNYGSYIGFVFGMPLAAAFGLTFLMCLGCCICRTISAPYSKQKNVLCIVLYTIIFITLCVFACVGTVFNLFAYTSYQIVKDEGVDLFKKFLNIPADVKASLHELTLIIPDLQNTIMGVLVEMDRLETPFDNVWWMVQDARKAMDEAPAHINNMNSNFTVIRTCAADLTKIGYSHTVTPAVFDTFNFQPASAVLNAMSEATYTSMENIVISGRNALNLAQGTVNSTVTTFTSVVSDTVHGLKYVVDFGIDAVIGGLGKIGLDGEFVDDVDNGTWYGEVGLMITILVSYVIFILTYAGCFCCMCRNGKILRCGTVPSCCGVWWLCIIGGLFLTIFFFCDDVCNQAEYTFQRARDWLPPSWDDILNLTVPIIGGGTAQVDVINATLNALYCGHARSGNITTYLEAFGLTFRQLNVTTQLEPYTRLFTDGLAKFDALTTLSQLTAALANFSSGVSSRVNPNYALDVSVLQSAVLLSFGPSSLNSYLVDVVGYDATVEASEYAELDTILTTYCPTLPYAIDKTNITQFNLTVLKPIYCVGIPGADETRANDVLRPSLVDFHAADTSDNATWARGNVSRINQAMSALAAAEIASRQSVMGLLDTPAVGNQMIIELNAGYAVVQHNVSTLIPAIADSMDRRIARAPILDCRDLGNFYTSLAEDGCGVFITSLGFIGWVTVGIAGLYFFFFWVIIYTSSMLSDLSKNSHTEKVLVARELDSFSDVSDFSDSGSETGSDTGSSSGSDRGRGQTRRGRKGSFSDEGSYGSSDDY